VLLCFRQEKVEGLFTIDFMRLMNTKIGDSKSKESQRMGNYRKEHIPFPGSLENSYT
jgi:hypothetical protein